MTGGSQDDGAGTTMQDPPRSRPPRRLEFDRVRPEAAKAQLGMEAYVRASDLERSLVELVKLRASYLNGCAYCVDMHTQDALLQGEEPQRLFAVPVWRETPFFSERERSALAWTDALTEIGRRGVPDSLFEAVREHFSEEELVDLTMTVITINGWNRLAIGFRAPVGSYRPRPAGGPEPRPDPDRSASRRP